MVSVSSPFFASESKLMIMAIFSRLCDKLYKTFLANSFNKTTYTQKKMIFYSSILAPKYKYFYLFSFSS